MNRSYYYKRILEKSVELENASYHSPSIFYRNRISKKDLKLESDEDLLYLYENLKLRVKEVHSDDFI